VLVSDWLTRPVSFSANTDGKVSPLNAGVATVGMRCFAVNDQLSVSVTGNLNTMSSTEDRVDISPMYATQSCAL